MAHDSRPSCPELLAAAVAGANISDSDNGGDIVYSMGEQTTPCLHWGVMEHGTEAEEKLAAAYVRSLASGYVDLLAGGTSDESSSGPTKVRLRYYRIERVSVKQQCVTSLRCLHVCHRACPNALSLD